MNAGAPRAILIVEDEQIVAMDIQESLRGMGYDPFAIASSGVEALARVAERRPDIVLMDIRIRGPEDGIETAAVLQERFELPVVYLTAHGDQSMVERAKKTSPDGYLLKPVNAAEMRSTIEVTLHKRDLERSRRAAAQLELREQALLQAARLKDQFLANMSHELRTPLNGIIGFAELMRDGLAGPLTDKQQDFLQSVLESGRRFLSVINGVLDLARLESGGLTIKPVEVDLAQLIGGVIDALRPSIVARRHDLDVRIAPECTTLISDPELLRIIVHQYLSNAVKFTAPGGALAVHACAEEPDVIRFAVLDNGLGIPREELSRVFVAFEQLDSGSGKRFDGAGVGLALVKGIAEAMGGRVGVESVQGHGSRFFADLPRIVRATGTVTGSGA